MSDRYVTLVGAEQVQHAASTMRSAADDMKQAAATISEALYQQRIFLDDWLARLVDTMEKRDE